MCVCADTAAQVAPYGSKDYSLLSSGIKAALKAEELERSFSPLSMSSSRKGQRMVHWEGSGGMVGQQSSMCISCLVLTQLIIDIIPNGFWMCIKIMG
jgi:hypothetical protein